MDKNTQTSLAGGGIGEEEKLRQAKKAKLQKKYRMITVALIAVIIVAGVIFVKSIWTGWGSSNGNRCYYIKGERVIGFANIDNNSYFFADTGAMQTGWQDIQGATYYFGSDGVMQTSWIELDGNKYYLAADGKLQRGWQTIGGSRYYFDPIHGVMKTGWQYIDGNTYYLNSNGIMQTGFQTIAGSKYYLGDNGILHTGWLSLNGKNYYCSASKGGKLATGKWAIEGNNYYFENSGVMVTGSVEISPNNVYHFDENGRFQYCDITKTNLSTTSSDSYVTLTNRGGGYTRSHSQHFDNAVENVLSMKIELKITGMDYGNANGKWQVHIRTLNGKWKRVGYFDVSNDIGVFEITFDEPLSFDAFICTCYESTSWSGFFYQDLESISYRSYDFGTGVSSE